MNTDTGAATDQALALLTVLQAAWVLGIGRTKAYAMTHEWRATGGKSGMKVIEVGGQLRVPRVWLEELIGAPIEFVPDSSALAKRGNHAPSNGRLSSLRAVSSGHGTRMSGSGDAEQSRSRSRPGSCRRPPPA